MKTFSSDEIFQIAQQIERNGMAYYNKAAKVFTKDEHRKLFKELSMMEEHHLNDYTKMREEFFDSDKDTVFDVNNEAMAYMQAIANGNVFDPKSNPVEFVKPDSDVIDIIKRAIEMEKNSIIFYIGLKDMVPSKPSKRKVEAIIQQELKHILMLSEKINGDD
jgi:rubrerythrin